MSPVKAFRAATPAKGKRRLNWEARRRAMDLARRVGNGLVLEATRTGSPRYRIPVTRYLNTVEISVQIQLDNSTAL